MDTLKQIPDKLWLLCLLVFLVPLYLYSQNELIGSILSGVAGALLVALKTKQQTVQVFDRQSAKEFASLMREE